jgi:geranylgeranyl diphosphate synthase type I
MALPESRRKKFGSDMAILAGDLMQSWAFELIDQSACSSEVKLKLARELRDYGYLRLVSGEALDVEMSYRNVEDISESELYAMQTGKTGALLHYAARAGWMAGRGTVDAWDEPEAVALGKFGDALAIAFQLRDDYLGIFGKFEEFGKPIGSDLQESKATMLLIHALNNLQGTQKSELQALLGRSSYSAKDIQKAQELFYQSGSVEKLLNAIKEFSHAAQAALDVLPESAPREMIKTLSDYLINREK